MSVSGSQRPSSMASWQVRLLALAIVLLSKDFTVSSLELLELKVPAHVPLGTRPSLSCRWQLGPSDILYSVKWYKDGKEFFRHVPREVQQRRKFLLPGVDVENSTPNASNVTLSPVVLESGGRYRCEVSGERPLFPTVSDYADMIIVALPATGPIITGSKLRYQIGDKIQVNCTSGRSRPATKLSWYINGEPAPMSLVLPTENYKHEDGLETTSLVLDIKAKPKHFKKGDLKLKCLATIGTVYWRSNEESVQRGRSKGYGRSREIMEEASKADRIKTAGKSGLHQAIMSLPSFMLLLTLVLHIPSL